jgi:hypothetical protein
MPIPWDADVLSFAWTTAKIIFGRKQRAREIQRAIPVQPEFEQIPEHALTQAQRDYIRPFDSQLASLNYRPDCTYRITNMRNYGHNLVRRYFNSADFASCTLTIIELKTKIGDVEAAKTSSTVAFRTRFSDERTLTTRNMSLKSLVDRPPWKMVQECRQIRDLAELKRRHDRRVAQVGVATPPPSGPEAIFKEERKEHQRFSEFQMQRGIYRLLPDGQAYETTDKARVRGIWNHYNPFAKRISWREVILSGLVGSVLPLLAILKVAPAIAEQLYGAPVVVFPFVTSLTIATFYALAGLIIGAISERATYHWIMLISYVPAHLFAGWRFGWFPYSTLMFVVAMYVIRAKRRRALIFETRQN